MIIKKCLEQSILKATNNIQESPVLLEDQSYVTTTIVSGVTAPEFWQSEQAVFDFEFAPDMRTFQFSMSDPNAP
jgi:hypothetical protein